MERRYFLKANFFGLLAWGIKSADSEAKSLDHELSLETRFCELKKLESVKLPQKPIPIESLVHFKIPKNCSKQNFPRILSNGNRVNGLQITEISLQEIGEASDFYLQYVGDEIGWIILT